ncbi:MAG TPA: RNA polymerase sigma factor [Thermoanaerobaculia bacterium]|nr:RNA polymerase sigma factor [Thermoanaerobaculia bacterium]
MADRFETDDSPRFANRLGSLFEASHQRLFRLGCRMTGDPDAALDLVQEAFLRAASRPALLPDTDPAAEAWLVRVLVNLCRDGYRKSSVRTRHAGRLDRGETLPSQESSLLARDLVQTAFAALPPRRRAIVALHELEELSVRDIARMLSVTEVTVRWHLAMGRKAMAARLAEPKEKKK